MCSITNCENIRSVSEIARELNFSAGPLALVLDDAKVQGSLFVSPGVFRTERVSCATAVACGAPHHPLIATELQLLDRGGRRLGTCTLGDGNRHYACARRRQGLSSIRWRIAGLYQQR